MYVYDEANNLAKAIQDSKEYKEYKKAREQLLDMPEMKTKIDDFEKIRYEVQVMSFQGEKQDEEKMKKLQEMYDILMKEPQIKEYFDVEVRFNIMLADVNKIISESVKDLL
ncbi:MAG: YlbF family regulator [Clostridia bacterium]|nr:YlbF family regulator [Clostridia bacterium]